ncbi:class F sortase [Candidatus Saccharibacteria bacterium]|nr:class F sortase [Candidatus Saccharibacteria bacterium]
MSTQRLSLSSPVFAGRVKKYDSYFHDSRTSQRTPLNVINKSARTISQNPTKTIQKHPMMKNQSHFVQKIQTEQPRLLKQELFGNSQKLTFGLSSPVKHANSSSISHLQSAPINTKSNPINLATRAVAEASKHQVSQNLKLASTIEKQFKEESTKLSFKAKLFRAQSIFYALGVSVFLFASFVSVQTFMNNKQAKEQLGVLGEQTWTSDEQGVQEGTSEDPSDAPVNSEAVANYKVDPELPRYIKIPEIGVYARIKQTGITKNGAVAAPSNINDVSWFNESARPGNPNGSSLLLGHVSGWTASGVFKKIDKLTAGSRIEIDKGSGEKLMYEVTRTEKVPVDQLDMSKILASEVVGEHDLKLITCGGKYDRESKEYTDRVIVYAKFLK